MPARRSSSSEPSLLVAIWWLFLAACALVMLLGGVNFISSLFGSHDREPRPAPTVTVTETPSEPPPAATSVPDSVIDDGLDNIPTPSACTDAGARGVIPRDRWTPCGQVLGYFDDWTTPPPGAPVLPSSH